MAKESIQEEDITIVKIYALKKKHLNTYTLTGIKGKFDSNTI